MRDARRLVVIGTGESARMAREYFTHDSPYEVVAFSTERPHLDATSFEGLPAIPLDELARRYPPEAFEAFVAISGTQVNKLRRRLFREVKRLGYHCASYVHSSSELWHDTKIGENCLIGALNVVQPFVEIGDDVIMHSGNMLGHRVVVEDHCFISAGVTIGGFSRIGASSFLGLNSTFNDGTGVSHDCVVASGALVRKTLTEPGRVYMGMPAKMVEGMSSSDVDL